MSNDTPLAERSDDITEEAPQVASEAPKDSGVPKGEKKDIGPPEAAEAPSVDEDIDEQREHDHKVLGSFYPEEEAGDALAGLELDRMSLTTLKFMQRAGSKLIEGVRPETMQDILREIAVYLVAHDNRKGIRERAKIFMLTGEDFEMELDCFMHEVPVIHANDLLMKVATRVAEETSTMVVPLPEDDDAEAPDLENV